MKRLFTILFLLVVISISVSTAYAQNYNHECLDLGYHDVFELDFVNYKNDHLFSVCSYDYKEDTYSRKIINTQGETVQKLIINGKE